MVKDWPMPAVLLEDISPAAFDEAAASSTSSKAFMMLSGIGFRGLAWF
jgi:hypothetical protein